MADRFLIVNADDFGQSDGINRGVIEAHERGIVTSASLMVRWPAAAAAARYAEEHAKLSLGLHFDLYEWTYRNEEWSPVYEVTAADDAAAVRNEARRQLEAFRSLAGRDPTHIDSHQHAHRQEPVRSALIEIADQLGVPLRHHTATVRYCGEFYGQSAKGHPCPEAISVERLVSIIAALPPGITELGCHPGHEVYIDTMYESERAQEVKALCDTMVKDAIVSEGVELCSFHNLKLHEENIEG